jgi:CPA2 family monovalent cation:H+ antiporter-2
MGAATVATLLFRWLKQPIVLGYILAGLMVGPYLTLFPSVGDRQSVEVWAQIGVIILLFNLGLEFSFRKLIRVGGTASITASVQLALMLFLGFSIGRLLGWSTTDSIFLGAMISISSTTIIFKAFEELGVKEKKFAGLVFGVLIVQDLMAILMLVLLPAFAIAKSLSGADILMPVGKLVFFLVLWFTFGIFFLPTLLRKAGNFMNDEILLVTSLALCFMMVVLANEAGLSSALGAFIMGSILAETRVGGKIAKLTESIKEMFGAVFFVSVGMMIDPWLLPMYWKPILIIALTILIGQPIGSLIGALLSRQQLKTSVQAAMSLSQIGEFSFIIASLGLSLNLTSSFLYPVAVAVSAITTFTTPYMIRASLPAYNLLYRKMPHSWRIAVDRFSREGQPVKPSSDWQLYIKSYLLHTFIYTVLIVGIVFLVAHYAVPSLSGYGTSTFASVTATLLTLLLTAPLLWALAIRKIQSEIAGRLIKDSNYKAPVLVLQIIRFAITLLIIGFLVHQLASYYWALGVMVAFVLLLAFNYRKLQVIHIWMERRFLSNFQDKEKLEYKEKGKHLTPWDAHITTFTVPPDFKNIGKPLLELKLREDLGVNVAMIKRGIYTIQAPDRFERIYPGDVLYVIGSDDQVLLFKKYLTQNSQAMPKNGSENEISLQWVEITDGDFSGKTIKESAIRERTKGLIVGIERNNERILNPESNVTLQANDILWIVGNTRRIKVLEKIIEKGKRESPDNLSPQAQI